MTDIVSRHLSITGLVQGVGYRWSMVNEAQGLGLAGWVRNRRDGRVEAVASGPRPAVEKLIEWAKRGPAGAAVSAVEVSDWDGAVDPGFRQISTV